MTAGFSNKIFDNSEFIMKSQFNKDGYFEDINFTLLNDQLIRSTFGKKYNFLFIPTFNSFKRKINFSNIQFQYDIDENNLYVPKNYQKKIQYYSGNSWDVWGLTRMHPGQKWYNCYSKYKVKTFKDIIKTKKIFINMINNYPGKLVIKDPRLGLILNKYKLCDISIIHIKRKKESVIDSMKNHYGKRLFSKNGFGRYNINSNHFNYMIRYKNPLTYINDYLKIIDHNIKNYNSIVVEYEKIINGEDVSKINNFINGEIDISIIKNNN